MTKTMTKKFSGKTKLWLSRDNNERGGYNIHKTKPKSLTKDAFRNYFVYACCKKFEPLFGKLLEPGKFKKVEITIKEL